LINALANEFNQQRLSQRDLSEDENFQNCSTAKGPFRLFSTRLIHCPKLVQFVATRRTSPIPKKSTMTSTFSFLILKSFPRAARVREIKIRLFRRDLSTSVEIVDDGGDRKR